MPRSSRNKSSKHSSREVRDYSDSEKESGFKEKKGRDDSRHLKDSTTSSEKKKNESKTNDVSKDLSGGGGSVIVDEYVASSSLSKKRKEKEKEKEEEEEDRWTGGDRNEHDLSKSDSKRSSRREGNSVPGFDGEEGKRSGSRGESRHHRSERKERGEKEGGSERERKSSKAERLVDGVTGNENVGNEGSRKHGGEECGGKHGVDNNNNEGSKKHSGEERGGKHGVTNNNNTTEEELRNPESEREIDRRVKRKRDGSGEGDKHQDGAQEQDDRRLSRDDMSRSGKYKVEAHKDERIRDRYQEDADSRQQDDKQRDNRVTREYTSGRSEEKHLRNDKKDLDVSQKKSKSHGNDYDREADRERDRDHDHHDRERGREHGRDRERSRHERERDRDRDGEHDDRDHDLDRDKDRERDPERIRDRDREPERERERGRDRDRYHRERDRERIRDHDRTRDWDYDHDHDFASHVDDKGSRYKDDRGRRRSPDVYDDYHGDKSRRVELEADKDRSLSRKAHLDNIMGSNRRKASPSSRTHVSMDKYRDGIQDETKYGDSLRDGAASENLDKVPKYRSGEKRAKFDENYTGDMSERSPSTKASPAGIKERSPSASIDRRIQNRTTRRRSLDVDEAERKSSGSNDIRDGTINEDRQAREFYAKKPSGEEHPRAESPFHHKSSQGNMSSHGPGPSGFRTGADSPSYMGSVGDDARGHSGSRYRKSVDPHGGRGPGNAWKGVPNWPSPLPNGFLPFPSGPPGPHGPHHGGFPSMLSQFPPLFGVRPSLDINHPGMPYHMGDGDRFPGHVRSIGWQNMVDGPVPHFHGWDVSNGLLRDEHGMYGPGHLANAQRREMNVDMWKPNGDVNLDVTSVSQKESQMVKVSMDEVSSAPGASRPHVDNSCLEEDTSLKMNTPSGPSSTKDIPMTPAKVTTEKTPESSSVDDTTNSVHTYLAKLDISMDMADPELYNQFINLAVKGEPEFIEEVEVEYIEEKAIAKSKIGDLTVGLTFFPAVKDSIYQKAMELYNRQTAKRSSVIPNRYKLHSHPTSNLEVEHTSILDEKVDNTYDLTAKKEAESPVATEGIATTPLVEGKETASITSDEALNGEPLPSAKSAFDLGGQGLAQDLMVDKMDEDIDVDKAALLVESAYSDANELETESRVVGNDGKRGGGSEPASNESVKIGVSGDLILCDDSVKVCEALNLVSNESESGILSRIHDAPESTH